MRFIRRLVLWLGLIYLFLMLGVLLAARWLSLPSARPAPADAIVVLGGESPTRVLRAVELYEQGLASQIWITGDVPPAGSTISLADAFSLVAAQNGVPYEQQQLLPTTSTWEDAEQIRLAAQSQGVQRLLVVTSWYHGRRAMCVLNEQLAPFQIQLNYQAAASNLYPIESWWQQRQGWQQITRELLAITYYWLRFGIEPWHC